MFEDLNTPIPGTENFQWREALYLSRWNIHAIPPKPVLVNILKMAKQLQQVRDILTRPMLITSWWRPAEYNKLINGAPKSWHVTGGAVDFRCPGISADQLREILVPALEDLELRMENLPGASWVHVDNKEPGNQRYFMP
jgi:zinc D-Ala-D-Ala carboxypeptidase